MADNPSCPQCKKYNAVLNGVCRDCGYVVTELSAPTRLGDVVSDDDDDDVDGTDPDLTPLTDDPLAYRGRGRPRAAPGTKRREKLNVSFTESEMNRLLVVSARRGFKRIQDFARTVLLKTIEHYEKREGEK